MAHIHDRAFKERRFNVYYRQENMTKPNDFTDRISPVDAGRAKVVIFCPAAGYF